STHPKPHAGVRSLSPRWCGTSPRSVGEDLFRIQHVAVVSDGLNLAVAHCKARDQMVVVPVPWSFGAVATGDPFYCHVMPCPHRVAHLNRGVVLTFVQDGLSLLVDA